MNRFNDPSLNLAHIQISPSLEELMRVGAVFLQALTIGQNHPKLRAAIESIGEEMRRAIGTRPPSDLEPVARIRRLFKWLGIDATKERPSSERLLRRVLNGQVLPAVNDLVDSLDLVSLKLQFPIAVYDWDRVAPPVLIRIGMPDEGYPGIDGEEVRLQGKIVLVDGEGPFGSPSRDSERTRVTPRTARALAIAFGPADTPRAALEEVIREMAASAEEWCGARMAASGIIGDRPRA